MDEMCCNTLYEIRHSKYVGICLVFSPKQHLVKVMLFNNILIGPACPGDKKDVQKCDKINTFMASCLLLNKDQLYNLTRFRMGAWKVKVSSTHLHHINTDINRNQRHCPLSLLENTKLLVLKMRKMRPVW